MFDFHSDFFYFNFLVVTKWGGVWLSFQKFC